MEVLNFLSDNNIICVSTSDWDKPYGSKQQVMSIFVSDNRILYIEAQISLLHILLNPRKGMKRIMRSIKGLNKVGSLYIYTPIPLLPFGNYFLSINWINQAVLLFFLRRLVSKLNFRRPILWIYSINSAELLGKFNEKLTVYYCLDDFPSEINHKKRKGVMQYLERRLLISSDVAFVCAKSLFEERKQIRPDIHFVRSGVDFNSFGQEIDPARTPHDIRNTRSPRIGLIGTFDARIDTELVFFIAKQRPEWQIVLIGSNTSKGFNIQMLRKYANIHNLGFKENKLLAQYISMMDVCIIPYRTDGFNRHLFPLKTLEYLACGKPVVSTYLPELEDLRDVVKLSTDREDFVRNLELSLNERGNIEERKKVASGLSWRRRIELISSIVAEKLNKGK